MRYNVAMRTHTLVNTTLAFVCALFFMYVSPVVSKTTIESSTGAATFDFTNMANQFQSKIDLFGPNMADSVSLVPNLGYPIGKSTLGNFPGFELGFSVGSGLTGMDYFDTKNSTAKADGIFPGVSPTAAIHAGVGLGGGFDIIGKFSYLSLSMYKKVPQTKIAKLEKAHLLSTGGRVRYQLVKEHTVIPFLFSFGGISLSGGADYVYGLVRVSGTYSPTMPSITYNYSGTDYTLASKFSGAYTGRLEWSDLTATAQITAYFDFLYLFSFYTGFALTGGIGSYNIVFDGTGDLTVVNDGSTGYTLYKLASGPDNLANLVFTSKTGFTPIPFQPMLIVGLELNLGPIKINGETAVSLVDRSDINVLIGSRFQF